MRLGKGGARCASTRRKRLKKIFESRMGRYHKQKEVNCIATR